MATLYQITDDALALQELLDEITQDENGEPRQPTDEEKQAILALADDLKTQFERKAESILQFKANLDADSEMFEKEEKRMARHRKSTQRKSETLKWLIEQFMIRTKTKKVDCGMWTLRMQKNPPSLYILDERNIPEQFKKIEISIMKRELLSAMKDGLTVDGVEIQQLESLLIV